MTDTRAAIIKQTRREVLAVLGRAYPIPMSFETICGGFIEIETHYLRRDLTYLEDKGYVRWTNPTDHLGWAARKYILTAKGEEIASRLEIDPVLEP